MISFVDFSVCSLPHARIHTYKAQRSLPNTLSVQDDFQVTMCIGSWVAAHMDSEAIVCIRMWALSAICDLGKPVPLNPSFLMWDISSNEKIPCWSNWVLVSIHSNRNMVFVSHLRQIKIWRYFCSSRCINRQPTNTWRINAVWKNKYGNSRHEFSFITDFHSFHGAQLFSKSHSWIS